MNVGQFQLALLDSEISSCFVPQSSSIYQALPGHRSLRSCQGRSKVTHSIFSESPPPLGRDSRYCPLRLPPIVLIREMRAFYTLLQTPFAWSATPALWPSTGASCARRWGVPRCGRRRSVSGRKVGGGQACDRKNRWPIRRWLEAGEKALPCTLKGIEQKQMNPTQKQFSLNRAASKESKFLSVTRSLRNRMR